MTRRPPTPKCLRCGTHNDVQSFNLCIPCTTTIARADAVRKGFPEVIDDPVGLQMIATFIRSASALASPVVAPAGSPAGRGPDAGGASGAAPAVRGSAAEGRSNRKGRPVAAERPQNIAAS